jgi:hypothetical protein
MVQVDIGGLSYEIDEHGNIRKRRGRGFLRTYPDKDGYHRVSVTGADGKTYNEGLHRVQYRAWHGEIPADMHVDHIDDNKLNNHKDNLQLLSPVQNAVKGNAKHWTVISPEGEVFFVYNLKQFCREYGLHQGHLYTTSYKGWKLQ